MQKAMDNLLDVQYYVYYDIIVLPVPHQTYDGYYCTHTMKVSSCNPEGEKKDSSF